MEITPTVILGIAGLVLALFTAFAGIIGAFVRLESKTNAHTTDITELFKHTEDRSIHPPADDLDRRFLALADGMDKIEKQLEKLIERFDRFLNK